MNKKTLTETDIRTKFITPAIVGANGGKWNVMTQVREEIYFTKGRVIVRGKTVQRGEAKKADYLLFYKPDIPIAVVEAKDNKHSVGAGMQQALEYAEILDVPFAYSSNGDAFLEHDRTGASGVVAREIPLDQFPTPEELWVRYRQAKGYSPAQETIATQDYFDDGSGKSPRYFFDLVVVDECHRGSAAGDAAWRKVLSYFSSATQIGLTATPKETREVSNIHYFGEPIYTYSLRQGISDGFLAPYKVVRIGLDKDLEGWRPERGKTDKYGREIEDREYNERDFDRSLILEKRTERVAAKVTEFLKATDRYAKTIVFCENIDHAERMRSALVNANADLAAANKRYVMRITGDNDEGKAQLDNFTIMDFKRATALFADPDFDGEPVQIYEPASGASPVPPDEPQGGNDEESSGFTYDPPGPFDPPGVGEGGAPTKYYVGDVEVTVATERVQYLDEHGKLITESLKDFTRNTVRKAYTSLDAFLNAWNDAERKQAIVEELAGHGVFLDELAEQVGRDYDAFDLVCHVAFDQPPLTRRERAARVKKRHVFAKYGDKTRAVLDALLEKYADGGIKSVESLDILKVDPLTAFGTPVEIVGLFGGKQNYLAAIRELESELYGTAA